MTMGLRTLDLAYARNDRTLFQGLSLQVDSGQGLLIQGPNGSGKTSLLRVLTGLILPCEGQVLWNNQELQQDRLGYHEVLHFLGHLSGVKQRLTLRENLRYSQNLADQPRDEACLEQALLSVGLLPLQNQLAQHLSAGQKRRLALARLLAFPKKLWILDEPFTNLDSAGQAWLIAQMEAHLKNQGVIILASHQAVHFCEGDWKTLKLPLGGNSEARHV